VRRITKLLDRKRKLREEVDQLLDEHSRRKAHADYHARRTPRPCGMTVHPALGCPNGCLYCYVPDIVSVDDPPKLYGLSGLEVVAALLHNPSFVPGPEGTFLAFGSLCDPFHPRVVPKTVEYLEAVSRWLGNPCQLSTKTPVAREVLRRLASLRVSLNPLVTIVTLRAHRRLEPNAPTPEERFQMIGDMADLGLRPMLFLRPAIRGLVEHEYQRILSRALESGAEGVVVGSLRLSERIARRLSTIGLATSFKPGKGRFKTLPLGSLKARIIEHADSMGLTPFASACCANAYTASVPCMSVCWATGMCTGCPNDCVEKVPEVDEDDVAEAVYRLVGVKPLRVEVDAVRVRVAVEKGVKDVKHVKAFLQTAARRLVEFMRA